MQRAITVGSIILLATYFIVLMIIVEHFGQITPENTTGAITNFLIDPATEVAERARDNFWYTCLHMLPYFIISEGLLIFAILRFREKEGRKAATFHDNAPLEILWTVIPIISVIFITWPTYNLLDFMNTAPTSDLEIEVTGQRYFFKYTYMADDITIADEPLVVPANKNVTLSMTSVDVIHSYWVPAFGVKYDLVPGRTTQIWFNAKPGFYKGQCAELCGESHADMMIEVTVLNEPEYKAWIDKKVKEKQAALQATF